MLIFVGLALILDALYRFLEIFGLGNILESVVIEIIERLGL